MCQARLDTTTRPNRPRGGADRAPNSHIPTHRERAHCVLGHENDHEVSDVGTDLEAPAKAPRGDAGGRRPGAVGEAGDDEA